MFRVSQSTIAHQLVGGGHMGADTQYIVQTVAGNVYAFYADPVNSYILTFVKSLDHGLSWSPPVVIGSTANTCHIAVWYDRWSNIAAGLIHVAHTNTADDDTKYRTIDTENSDALSTETTIFAGASTGAGGSLSITRAVGGNVYCRTVIDAGAEGGFYRLPNANVPSGAWDAARTDIEALATQDQVILLPDLNSADNQDIYGIFWDASADEISRVNYDDSANTWAETSISGSMADVPVSASAGGLHYAAAVDIANSQTVLIAWSGVDTLNADLMCWTINSTTITAKTDVVTNSTDDQGLAAIGIDTDTGYWYAFYTGASDGAETLWTDSQVYMKVSTDSGTTWGAETRISNGDHAEKTFRIIGCPRFTKMFSVAMSTQHPATTSGYVLNMLSPKIHARAQVLLGV